LVVYANMCKFLAALKKGGKASMPSSDTVESKDNNRFSCYISGYIDLLGWESKVQLDGWDLIAGFDGCHFRF
jgi:hypothetical protein